jgi:hypothetical protein
VLDAAYIHVTDDEIEAAGHERGVRGALLVVAGELDGLPNDGSARARVIVVVDRDYDAPTESEHLAISDGYSIESYCCSADAFHRFVTFVLGREPLPGGAGGQPPPRRRTCSGDDLLGRVMPAARQVAAVRLVLRSFDQPLAMFDRWTDYATVSGDGHFSVDGNALLRNILVTSGRGGEADNACAQLADQEARVDADPFRLVRGHDPVALLLKLLRSTWGRRIAGNRFASVPEHELARLMMFSIESAELDRQPLFARIRAAVA